MLSRRIQQRLVQIVVHANHPYYSPASGSRTSLLGPSQRFLLQQHYAAVRNESTAASSSRKEDPNRRKQQQQQQQQQLRMMMLPPNLKIDPRSSFLGLAQQPLPKYEDEKQENDVDDEEDEFENDIADNYDDEDDDSTLVVSRPEVAYAIPLPDRLNIPIYTLLDNSNSNSSNADEEQQSQYPSKVGTLWLDAAVFGCDPIRIDLLHRAVEYYRAKKRGRRTAVTKTIAQVSGSGRKLRPQKGLGRARVGHSRPAHFRGGAKAHGPKNVTDYGNIKLNKKVRKLALANVLSQKLKEGNLLVVDQWNDCLPTHKTADLVRLLAPWGIAQGKNSTDAATALILDHYYPELAEKTQGGDDADNATATSYQGVPVNLRVASSNLYQIKVANDHGANVYDILKYDKLILTLSALQQIEGRLLKTLA